MLTLPSSARKVLTGGLAALTLAGSLAFSAAPADAAWRGRHHGHHGGWIGPAIVGGLALGALAAATAPHAYGAYAAPYGERCWIERQRVLNRWGQPVVRRVQVCG